MAHEIRATDAIAYLLADGMPWHGIGETIENIAKALGVEAEHLTVAEAMRGLGMDYPILNETPFTIPEDALAVFRQLWRNGDGVTREEIVTAVRQMEPWKHKQAIVRSDTRAQFEIMGSQFTPWQNLDAAAFFDEIVAAAGGAHLSVLGSLKGGRTVWVTAKLDAETRIGGTEDVSRYHLLLSHAHDGTLSIRIDLVCTRVVCANTHRMALREGRERGITLRHTRHVGQRLEEAKRALGIVSARIDQHRQLAEFLASVQVPSAEALRGFVEAVVPPAPEGVSDARRAPKREAIYDNFMDEDRNAVAGVKGSWWTAYNAVTQLVDHGGNGGTETTDSERRFRRNLYGSGARLKDTALRLAFDGARGERLTQNADGTVTVASEAGTVTVDGSELFEQLLNQAPSGRDD